MPRPRLENRTSSTNRRKVQSKNSPGMRNRFAFRGFSVLGVTTDRDAAYGAPRASYSRKILSERIDFSALRVSTTIGAASSSAA
jgi:hypothetical protein